MVHSSYLYLIVVVFLTVYIAHISCIELQRHPEKETSSQYVLYQELNSDSNKLLIVSQERKKAEY